MGWQDDAVVESQGWQADEVVGKTPQTLGERAISSAKSFAAPVEAAAAMVTGMVSGPLSGFAGMWGAALPGPQGQGADWQGRVQDAMTYKPKTEGGQAITGAVAAPFELLAKGADRAGEAVSNATDSPAAGAATNTLIQAAPMAIGKLLPKAPAANPALKKAADAGLKVTPEEAGAGVGSRTAASLAGEPRLARKISRSNEAGVNDLIAQDLKLPEGTKVTRDVLEEIRSKNGGVYDEIRKSGDVAVDKPFMNDLGRIVKDHQGASKDFPRKGNPVMEVYERLTKNEDGSVKRSFDANSAVSEIKNLRADAQKAFASRDTQLGKANLSAAQALENVLDRHMAKSGKMDAVQGLRDARQTIAKTYDAEKALMGDGQFNPQAYAKLLAKGKPLSGGALTVAEAARDFPRSMQKPSGQATGASIADFAAYALGKGGLSGGIGLDAALLGTRPAMRSVMASGPYQKAFIQRGLQGGLSSAPMTQGLPLGAFAGLAGVERGGGR